MRLRLGRPGIYLDVGRPTPEHQADRGPPEVGMCAERGCHVRNSGSVFGWHICLSVDVRVVSVVEAFSRGGIRIVSPVDASAEPLSRTSEPPTRAIVAIYLASRDRDWTALAPRPRLPRVFTHVAVDAAGQRVTLKVAARSTAGTYLPSVTHDNC